MSQFFPLAKRATKLKAHDVVVHNKVYAMDIHCTLLFIKDLYLTFFTDV